MTALILKLIIFAPGLIFAVTLHEVAHGWVAYRLGDPTAKLSGRLTINPIRHIDLFGSILLPAVLLLTHSRFLFGYAKPVPVNFSMLKNPKRDIILVSVAGCVVNFMLAIASSILFHIGIALFTPSVPMYGTIIEPVLLMLQYSILINLVLGIFNLIPIPPLDGGRILMAILPYEWSIKFSRIEPYGMVILIILMFSGILGRFVFPIINIMSSILIYLKI